MLNDSITLLAGADIANMVVASGASFPASPDVGELFFKTTDNKLYAYNGSSWTFAGSSTKADVGLGNVDNTADADKPISTAVSTALSGKESTANKNANSGYAGLDANGKIANSQLPALAITDTYVVASEAAMLALSAAEVGDVAVRTDINTSFILKTAGYSTLANWQELLSPSGGSITIGSTSIAIGASSSTLAGLTSVGATTFTGALSGNATSATNIAGGVAGGIPYQTASGATSITGAGTEGYVLTAHGSGAPTWQAAGGLGTTSSYQIGSLGIGVPANGNIGDLVLSRDGGVNGVLWLGNTGRYLNCDGTNFNFYAASGGIVIANGFQGPHNGTVGATTPAAATFTTASATTFTGALSGNATTATTLQTARNINGVSFNGSADITVAVAGSALTGTSLASGIVSSSLTSVGTLTSLAVSGSATVGGLDVGTKIIPQNIQSSNYTTVLTDSGKQIFHPAADTTARTYTIDSNANVAYPIGTALTFINQNSAGAVTIAITSDTMRLAGTGTTGNRTLAANGIATAIKVTATEWIISGTGLS